MKRPLATEGIHYDASQFFSLKTTLETLLGERTHMRLKGAASLRSWKDEVLKLLRAIEVSVKSTVEIADTDWFEEIDSVLERGRVDIARSKSATSLFANLSSTLTELVFIQLGCFPKGRRRETIPLTKRWWTLRWVRSVQYVQTNIQRQTAQELRDKRKKTIQK
jgi:hypothetical protein